jgi:hypothetical protein
VDRDERRLQWVQHNRAAKDAQRVGVVAAEVLAQQVQSGPAWRRQLLAVLAKHAGPAFLNRVIVTELCGGVLRLEVADPGELYALRVEWEQRLARVFQAELPAAGIHTVRFTLRGREH